MALTKNQEIIVGVVVLGVLAFLMLGGSGGKTPDNLPVPPSDDDDKKPPKLEYDPMEGVKTEDAKKWQQLQAGQQQFQGFLRGFDVRFRTYYTKRQEFWEYMHQIDSENPGQLFPLTDTAKKLVDFLYDESVALFGQAKNLLADSRVGLPVPGVDVRQMLESSMATLDSYDKPLWIRIQKADLESDLTEALKTLPTYTHVTNNHLFQINNQNRFTGPVQAIMGGDDPLDDDEDMFKMDKGGAQRAYEKDLRRERSRSPTRGRSRHRADSPYRSRSRSVDSQGRETAFDTMIGTANRLPPPLRSQTNLTNNAEESAFNTTGDDDEMGNHGESDDKSKALAKIGSKAPPNKFVSDIAEEGENKRPVPDDFESGGGARKQNVPTNEEDGESPSDALQRNQIQIDLTGDDDEMEEGRPAGDPKPSVLGKRKGGGGPDMDSAPKKLKSLKEQQDQPTDKSRGDGKFVADGKKKKRPSAKPEMELSKRKEGDVIEGNAQYLDALSAVNSKILEIVGKLEGERRKKSSNKNKMKNLARQLFAQYEELITCIPNGREGNGLFVSPRTFGTNTKGTQFKDAIGLFQATAGVATTEHQITSNPDAKFQQWIRETPEWQSYSDKLLFVRKKLNGLCIELWGMDIYPQSYSDLRLR